jgi:hypothetical protein
MVIQESTSVESGRRRVSDAIQVICTICVICGSHPDGPFEMNRR